MTRAEKILNLFEDVSIMKNPEGGYKIVGKGIPVKLLWVNKDGSLLSDRQSKIVAKSNDPGDIAKSRVFKSETEAKKAAKKEKLNIVDKKGGVKII